MTDSCKFMHDRTDYKHGWEIEKDWQEGKLKEAKDDEYIVSSEEDGDSDDDKLPHSCYICREHFRQPVVTKWALIANSTKIFYHITGVSIISASLVPSKIIRNQRNAQFAVRKLTAFSMWQEVIYQSSYAFLNGHLRYSGKNAGSGQIEVTTRW